MAVKRSPASIAISTLLVNLGILAALLFAFRNQIVKVIPPRILSNIDVNITPGNPSRPKAGNMGGGGGGVRVT